MRHFWPGAGNSSHIPIQVVSVPILVQSDGLPVHGEQSNDVSCCTTMKSKQLWLNKHIYIYILITFSHVHRHHLHYSTFVTSKSLQNKFKPFTIVIVTKLLRIVRFSLLKAIRPKTYLQLHLPQTQTKWFLARPAKGFGCTKKRAFEMAAADSIARG